MIRDLLDYWNWWKTRRSQVVTLVFLAGLIVWMNVALLQAERNYRGVVAELRHNYRQQEATRERQFSRMLSVLESHLSRMDVDSAKSLKQQEQIREMLDPLLEHAAKCAEHDGAKAARPQQ
jgi:hypothetical protein